MTDNSRASESTLAEVHQLLAKRYKERLLTGEITAAELASLVKFLKDNNINCDGRHNPDLAAIADSLPEFDREGGLELVRYGEGSA